MRSLLISFQSEFYKSRKTLAFWSAIILPVLICGLINIGFFNNAAKIAAYPSMMLWMRFIGSVVGIMGTLLLPMLVIFMAYSVNSMEHKSDTWKTLFTLPLPKFAIYTSKYLYLVFLTFLCLALFATITLGSGYLLGIVKPELKFSGYSISPILFTIYIKLFLSSLGIISLQFLMSLVWSDFLKPMGIGFVGTIAGIITSQVGWAYAYLIPYAHPNKVVQTLSTRAMEKGIDAIKNMEIFDKDIYTSLIYATVIFIAGYFIVARKSIK